MLIKIPAACFLSTFFPYRMIRHCFGLPGDLHGTAAFLWAATAVIDYYSEPPISVRHKNSDLCQSRNPTKSVSFMDSKAFIDLKGRVITVNNTA